MVLLYRPGRLPLTLNSAMHLTRAHDVMVKNKEVRGDIGGLETMCSTKMNSIPTSRCVNKEVLPPAPQKCALRKLSRWPPLKPRRGSFVSCRAAAGTELRYSERARDVARGQRQNNGA